MAAAHYIYPISRFVSDMCRGMCSVHLLLTAHIFDKIIQTLILLFDRNVSGLNHAYTQQKHSCYLLMCFPKATVLTSVWKSNMKGLPRSLPCAWGFCGPAAASPTAPAQRLPGMQSLGHSGCLSRNPHLEAHRLCQRLTKLLTSCKSHSCANCELILLLRLRSHR